MSNEKYSQKMAVELLTNTPFLSLTNKELFELRNSINDDDLGFFEEVEGGQDDNLQNNSVIASTSVGNCKIVDNLTNINYTNYGSTSRIKYIVIHYTAGNGDTPLGNTNYFKNTYRGASAHYFVNEGSEIYRCVEDKHISWHCGGGLQGSGGHKYYKICTNKNSIGIEMCSRLSNGKYYFKEQTITNTINLVKHLMNKYNVPVANVIRHYDVVGKICPAPFVNDESAWQSFKDRLTKKEEKTNEHWALTYYNKLSVKGWIGQTEEDKKQWMDFDSSVKNSLVLALIDKFSGGTWTSNQTDSNIHWAQPHVISLAGKKIISDKQYWLSILDSNCTKGLVLALVDKMTDGTRDKYVARFDVDHWARNNLDSLCDKAIIDTPTAWIDFDNNVSKGLLLAILCKVAKL